MITIKPTQMTVKINRHIKEMPKNFRIANKRGLYLFGKRLVETANTGILKEVKKGRVYRTRRGRIRSSAPGQYPANITGNYRRGLGFNVLNSEKMIFGAEAEYAKFLESGTSFMKQRPALTKSVKSSGKNISKLFNDVYQKVVFRR